MRSVMASNPVIANTTTTSAPTSAPAPAADAFKPPTIATQPAPAPAPVPVPVSVPAGVVLQPTTQPANQLEILEAKEQAVKDYVERKQNPVASSDPMMNALVLQQHNTV